MIVTGGAPISPELFNFFRAAFKGLIVAGYGSTEVSGVTSVTVLGESHEGTVGAITSRIEVKLADVLDMDIVALRDNRGEICIKGKRCTKGYFQDPESTAQIIDADGWLHTGDIGEWTTVSFDETYICKSRFYKISIHVSFEPIFLYSDRYMNVCTIWID
ncbi:unnamed protein product [Schistosoma curassoni]|uniref:long-chain-fatty-acid--CoA ligase n=1 Tax=Schistosoma curassoni TaxID=6186 RepID=A0A183KYG6_9TREM|nr:unnamed protein product [Schistosoma curassoni]